MNASKHRILRTLIVAVVGSAASVAAAGVNDPGVTINMSEIELSQIDPDLDFSEIVGGGPVSSHPAVAALINVDANDNPFGICSGTLIGPSTILTAAHCVDDPMIAGILVYFGQDVFAAIEGGSGSDPGYIGHTFATSARAHPAWTGQVPDDNDIAVIELADPGPVAPMGLSTQAPVSGTPLELIGWGKTIDDAPDSGIKRGVQSQVGAVMGGLLQVGAGQTMICQGDSGGPAFVSQGGSQLVAGVASFTQNGCNGAGFSVRVDAQLQFINGTGGGGGGGGPGGGDVGAFCQGGNDCASGLCATLDGQQFCTSICTTDNECPSGFECGPTSEDFDVCLPTGGGGPIEGEEEEGEDDGGGCSSSGQNRGPAGFALLVLAALFARRRRC